MMRIMGIVAEYNPFHNGHAYQLQRAGEACGAEAVVAVMSGSFTQRGEPAIADKWARAEAALRGGCDLVLELPWFCATSSAEGFARGAIDILDGLGFVTHLGFGSENPDTRMIMEYARILNDEPPDFKGVLSDSMSGGLPYGRAVEKALALHLHGGDRPGILSTPNMILGVQYARRLLQLGSRISIVPVGRHSAGYHDHIADDAMDATGIASATGIRARIRGEGGYRLGGIAPYVPETTLAVLERELAEKGSLGSWEGLEPHLMTVLRRRLDPEAVMASPTEGLAERLVSGAHRVNGFMEACGLLKSKRHHMSRVQRLLCHLLVGLTPGDARRITEGRLWRYARVLGFNGTGRRLIALAREAETGMPVIGKLDRSAATLDAWPCLELDVIAQDIHALGHAEPRARKARMDYMRPPVMLP